MKRQSIYVLLAGLCFLTSLSCRKTPVVADTNASCQLTTFKEFENIDPQVPGSGSLYKELEFEYQGKKLVRIDTKTRGVLDGYRLISYKDDKVDSVKFFKNNALTYAYKFNYEAGSNRVGSVDVEFHIVAPFVKARYVYEYDASDRVSKLTHYYSGNLTGYITYSYEGNKATASIFEASYSDPNYKLQTGINEYEFDEKHSANFLPAFAWNQYHQEQLDLIQPASTHNIIRYTAKSLRSRSSSTPEFDVDNGVSYSAAISYTQQDFPSLLSENRLSGSVIRYSYLYSNCH